MAKPAGATGRRDGPGVVVGDAAQAARLHAKALAGTLRDGALRLTAVEAAHCIANGWLAVDGVAAGTDLLADAGQLTDFLAYRDVRERGFVARPGRDAHAFDVWPRGTGDGEPAHRVRAYASDAPVRARDLVDAAEHGVVCAVVDEDSLLTHYQLATAAPAGEVPDVAAPIAGARRVADRVRVDGAAALAAASYGTPQGDARLLSALEAEHLQARGLLRVDGLPRSPPEVLAAYAALRAAGAVPKSGLRFGTHLRAYASAPDDTHADWLVHAAKADDALPWSVLARGVRLAHGVRKKFLVAVATPQGGRFVHLAWQKL